MILLIVEMWIGSRRQRVGDLLGLQRADALEDLPNVPQVEGVVTLGWGGQQILPRGLEGVDRAVHDMILPIFKDLIQFNSIELRSN